MTVVLAAARGLSREEAARRLDRHGPNSVAGPPRSRLPARVLRQLRDPLIVVLIVAAVLTSVTGDYADTVIIAVVVAVNAAVGVVQELRAERAIDALSAMTAPEVRVRRDDTVTVVAAADLVPGDVVLLGEGDIVPADARLLEAAGVAVDESALTGESVAVGKDAASGDDGSAALWAGTVMVRGRAEAVVTATGADSAVGRVAALLVAPPVLTPLQRRLVGLGRAIAVAGALLCLVVLAVGVANGRSLELMVVTAVSLLVAAVPESLPAVVTLALALGARRMAARHALVRRLPAVETLGSVSVLATDKTGTLTEGRMVVEHVWTPAAAAVVTGGGYTPQGGCVSVGGVPVGRDDAPPVTALLEAAVLCNDAALRPPADQHGEWEPIGDPLEAALITAAARIGISKTELDRRVPRIAEIPFDSNRRRMTTVHRLSDGRRFVVCKGAPEVVLDRVAADAATVQDALAQAEHYAARGYRVLAVATGVEAGGSTGADRLVAGLALAGLIAVTDPPRPAAAATIARCRGAGIHPVLVTGDHAATALTIARRVGIADADGTVVTGRELAAGEVPDVTKVQVLARTRPEQKVAVIEAWQRAGHVVAMTGDGVNDGPALRRADIGVAMGRRGSEVARQAADLVLADDDLDTVVVAVEEGRRIYDNVRRFLLYGLAGGSAEILIMLIGPALGLALPLLPAQILWINLVTHGIPGVALGAEPAEPDVLERPPRPAKEHVLGDGLAVRVALLGVAVATVSLGVGLGARAAGRPWQTMLFVALAATQLAAAIGVRARVPRHGHRLLLATVGCAFVVSLAGVYLPALGDLLGTHPLSAAELAVTLAASAAGCVAARALSRPPGATRRLAGA